MADFARRRPGMCNEREYHAIESNGHKTAIPLITICLDKGGPRGLLSYGVNSRMCRVLTETDRKTIVETVQQILEERK